MASTTTKKRARTSKTSRRANTSRTRRISVDEERLVELVKRSVREALAEERAAGEQAADAWDLQIEADAKAGKLDALVQQALEDLRQGKAKEL